MAHGLKDGGSLFAFESIIEEEVLDPDIAAGTTSYDGTPVPSGKVWKITWAAMQYTGTPPTNIELQAVGLAAFLPLEYEDSVVSHQWYMWGGEIYLQEGDYIRMYVVGGTATDDVVMRYTGVQMNAP